MNERIHSESGQNQVREKKNQKTNFNTHREEQWWEKAFVSLKFKDVMSPSKSKKTDKNLRTPLNDEGLALIYGKLKECCDDAESELKEAIDYGLRLISGRRHHRDKRKPGRQTKEHASQRLGDD